MSESGESRQSGGIGAALSQLAANALALLRTRLELAAVELQESTALVKELLVLAVAGALLAVFTLLFASIFVIVCLWDSYPIAAVGGVTLFYLLLTVVVLLRLRDRVRARPGPFAATLAEFQSDIESLRDKR